MYRIHIVSHTHWDREWYLSYQHYRIRLTRMVKKVLGILDADPGFSSFFLDGQSIVLQDYLEIHPEDREKMKTYITAGRIKLGPWYVQPDEALVSGESLIRNFAMGIESANEMGSSMDLGYLPDMFGHNSQMPQILSGFGIDSGMFWRGLGTVTNHSNLELAWEGADGTELFSYRFPNAQGYGSLFRLYDNPQKAAAQIRKFIEESVIPFTSTQTFLIMLGVDHTEPQANLSEVLREAAQYLHEYTLIQSSPDAFMEEIRQHTKEHAIIPHRIQGELRHTNYSKIGVHNFLLANVLSSRIYIKQKNTEAQYLLERWAEPLASILFAAEAGQAYPGGLLKQSWEYLLQNHPHDSICGCSRDEVHRQMMTRFEWSMEISGQLADEALYTLAAMVDTSMLPEGHIILHAMNPSEWPRTDSVTVDLFLPLDTPRFRRIDIYRGDGQLMPSQIVDICDEYRCINHNIPEIANLIQLKNGKQLEEGGILLGFELNRKVTVRFNSGDIPAMGYATFTAVPVLNKPQEKGIIVKGRRLENEYIRADIHGDGSLDLFDKQTKRHYPNLLIFENGGDIGDGYAYSPPLLDELFSTNGLQAAISVVEDGPAQGTMRIEYNWELPESIDSDRKYRSRHYKICRLVVRISLGKHNRWLGIEVDFDNQVRDHRLRVLLPTGIASDRSWANGAFDIIERSTEIRQPKSEHWIEDAVGAFPNHGFAGVTAADGSHGFAVAPFGLPEYELSPQGDLTLTLVRAVGYMGSPDPLTIANGAGPNFPTPEGQCQGLLQFQFALIPHQGACSKGEVWRKATEHHLPVKVLQLRKHAGTLPLEGAFLRIGDGGSPIALSAVKKAWKRDSVVVRLFNPTEQRIDTSLWWWKQIKEGYILDLQENRLQQVEICPENEMRLQLGAKKIMTLEIV